MRFKNKATYIALCVILSLLLIAGIFSIVMLGNKYRDREFDLDNSVWHDTASFFDTEESSSNKNGSIAEGEMRTQALPTSAISYEINVPYGNVIITPTDKEPYVEFADSPDIEIQTREKDHELKINVKIANHIRHLLFGKGDNKYKIHFYLPKEKLSELSLDIDAGNVEIVDINAKKLDLSVAAGNCVIKGGSYEIFETDIDAGNVQYYAQKDVRSIDIDVDAGNIKLMLPKEIEGFFLAYDVELGNLSNKFSFTTHSVENDFFEKSGIIKLGDESIKIKIDVAVGNASIDDYTD